jgi:hypothetical protein
VRFNLGSRHYCKAAKGTTTARIGVVSVAVSVDLYASLDMQVIYILGYQIDLKN